MRKTRSQSSESGPTYACEEKLFLSQSSSYTAMPTRFVCRIHAVVKRTQHKPGSGPASGLAVAMAAHASDLWKTQAFFWVWNVCCPRLLPASPPPGILSCSYLQPGFPHPRSSRSMWPPLPLWAGPSCFSQLLWGSPPGRLLYSWQAPVCPLPAERLPLQGGAGLILGADMGP